jgi:hypothetical protein
MPALDFPASPTNGQAYGNWIWNSSKGAWQAKPLVSAKTVTSDVPPSSPANGDQWFNTVDSTLYIYYTDVDGSQWVESRAPIISDGYYSPNYVINGAFDFWQRGTFSTASGAYLADRWLHSWTAGTGTASRSTDVPVTTLPYSFSIASTSGTNPAIQQRIEATNALQFVGQTVTFSIWAKSTVGTGALTWATFFPTTTADTFSAVTADQSGTFAATMTVGTWTRYSATFTVGAGAIRGLLLQVFRNVTTTSTTTLYAGAQLEVASVATPFRRNANSIQGELAACQRYYVRFSGPSTATIYGHAVSTATANQARAYVPLNTSMRIVPTSVEFSTIQSWWAANSSTITALAISVQSTISIVDLNATTSNSPSPGQFGFLIGNGSNSFIAFSAEL